MRKNLKVPFGVITVHEGILGGKTVDGQKAEATLDKKEIFLAGSRWRIKCSKIQELVVHGRSMKIKTDRLEADLEGALQQGLWDEFCSRVQSLYDKYHVAEPVVTTKRPKARTHMRRAFGRKGTQRVLTNARLENFDDDFDYRQDSAVDKSILDEEGKENIGELRVEEDEESIGSEEEPEASPLQEWDNDFPRKVTTTKKRERAAAARKLPAVENTSLGGTPKKSRLKKMNAKQRDEESDDEGIFDDDMKMTTPAAQRFVSPIGADTTPLDGEEVDREGDYVVPPDQPRISSYFAPKTAVKAKPKPSVVESPQTPSRPNMMSPAAARLIRASQKKSLNQKSWLQTSPARSNSAEKQRRSLFGNLAFSGERQPAATHEDDDLPTVRRTIIRPSLKPRSSLSLSPLRKKFLPDDLAPARPVVFTRPARGLRNLGNTCYINASLQMVSTLANVIDSLEDKGGRLTKSLVSVAKELRKDQLPVSANPRVVKEAMDTKTDKFSGYEQRDAHEFVSDLIDYVHDELQEEQKQSEQCYAKPLPTDEFQLTVKVCLTCQSCGYTRSKEELYRHLSIDVVQDKRGIDTSPLASIEMGLARFFEPETRELKCEKCENGTHASQTSQISSRPKALLLHLKRFVVEEKPTTSWPPKEGDENSQPNSPARPPSMEYVFRKNKDAVVIPEHLSLEVFGEAHRDHAAADPAYALKSIVHHIGHRQSSGHYTSDALRMVKPASGEGENEPTWISFDDTSSTRTTLDEIRSTPDKLCTAYMLLYTLSDNKE